MSFLILFGNFLYVVVGWSYFDVIFFLGRESEVIFFWVSGGVFV